MLVFVQKNKHDDICCYDSYCDQQQTINNHVAKVYVPTLSLKIFEDKTVDFALTLVDLLALAEFLVLPRSMLALTIALSCL